MREGTPASCPWKLNFDLSKETSLPDNLFENPFRGSSYSVFADPFKPVPVLNLFALGHSFVGRLSEKAGLLSCVAVAVKLQF